jgi:hypothetical protein
MGTAIWRVGCLLALGAAGCVQFAASRGELMTLADQREGGFDREEVVVEVPFDRLASHLERRANECLDRESETVIASPTMYAVIRNRYQPEMTQTSPTQAQFSLLWFSSGVNVPREGAYVVGVDMKQESSSSTHVVVAFPDNGRSDIWEAVRAWARGEEADCPEI